MATTRAALGTDAPTTGTWAVGDSVYNTNPVIGAPTGWICITGGTPGTWAQIGSVATSQEIHVENVAALRNVSPSLIHQVETEGYYVDNDGGGGTYHSVTGAAPGTYVDNGGTIIIPTGGDGSAAWLLASDNEINVLQFGAKNDASADVGAIVTAAAATLPLNAPSKIVFPPGDYLFTTPFIFPAFTSGAIVEIILDGALLRTTSAIAIFDGLPIDQTDAEARINSQINIRNGYFLGNATAGQYGIRMPPSYGSSIIGAQVVACDIGIQLLFCLNCRVQSIRTTNNNIGGILADCGFNNWTGGGTINSASNGTSLVNCRDFAKAGAQFQYKTLSSEISINNCIVEGANPVNSIVYDDQGSTVIKNFIIDDLHSENQPTNAIIKMAGVGGGTYSFSTIKVYGGGAISLLDAVGFGVATFAIRDIPYVQYLSPAFKITTGSGGTSGTVWLFEAWGQGNSSVTATANWSGGVAPQCLIHIGRQTNGDGAIIEGINLLIGNPSSVTTALIGFLGGARVYNLYNTSAKEYIAVEFASNVGYLRSGAQGTGTIRPLIYQSGALTFATLPAAATAGAGARAFITDCNSATFMAAAAGGGANAVPVVSNGAAWLVG